jgi:hypothetical protein
MYSVLCWKYLALLEEASVIPEKAIAFVSGEAREIKAVIFSETSKDSFNNKRRYNRQGCTLYYVAICCYDFIEYLDQGIIRQIFWIRDWHILL